MRCNTDSESLFESTVSSSFLVVLVLVYDCFIEGRAFEIDGGQQWQ